MSPFPPYSPPFHSCPLCRCRQTEIQEPIPVEDILEQYPEVYDTYDRDIDDEPIDLASFPLLDNEGVEIRIFTPEGNRIRRHVMVHNPHTPACGVLVDLRSIHDMYRDGDDNGEGLRRLRLAERRRRASSPSSSDDEDGDHAVPQVLDEREDNEQAFEREVEAMLEARDFADQGQRVDAYPQAFLAKYGHVQSNRMFPLYNAFIIDIEREIRKDVPPMPAHLREAQDREEHVYVDPADLEEWYEEHGGTGAIIEPCASQIYNELSHRTRPTATQQEVCTGSITQACTGAWVKSTSAKNVHDRILRRHTLGLPHERFRSKLHAGGPAPRALRVENVFVINMQNMPQEKRSGP